MRHELRDKELERHVVVEAARVVHGSDRPAGRAVSGRVKILPDFCGSDWSTSDFVSFH